MYPYEAMFLVDPVKHGEDPTAVEKAVTGLLEKHGAQIQQFERWDERKLAYEIKGHKRGVYYLGLFEMPGANLVELTHDCELSESILRQLFLRLDWDIPTYLEKCAKYQDAMREDQESRRASRRDDEDRESDENLGDSGSEGD